MSSLHDDNAWFWDGADASAYAELLLGRSPFHGVIFIDPTERIRGWNCGAHTITGFSAADVIGQPAAMLFTLEDRARGLADHELRIARDVGVAEDERWHIRKDRSVFWSSGHTMAFREPSGELTGYVKAFRDATHLRGRMKALENEAQACRADQSRTDTHLGAIAHEMRNPLAPLKNVLHLLQVGGGGTEVDPKLLQVMARQLTALEQRVEDLIDLTRVRTGKLRLTLESVVLQPLIEEAVGSCKDAADRKGVHIQTVLPSVPLEAVIDGGRLQQVVVNLLTNAIKFTDLQRMIWVTLTADQTHLMLQVKDQGCGIDAALLPRIFEAFTQDPRALTGRGMGVGLGLNVVRQIANLHQGTIEVSSKGKGAGSEFTLRIPLRPPEGATSEGLSAHH